MSGPFKLKSGNTTQFKQMGSSPGKQITEEEHQKQVVDDYVQVPYSRKYSEGENGESEKGLMKREWKALPKTDKKASLKTQSKEALEGLVQGGKIGLKPKTESKIQVPPKSHPVTPPEAPREDTLKGKTQFESDIQPVSNILSKGLGILKKVYIDNPKKLIKEGIKKREGRRKKVVEYFTKR